MITYCSKCAINWAKLWSQEEGEDSYEFCPVCKTDRYLGEATDIISFIRCPFTGVVKNIHTGERVDIEKQTILVGPKRIKVWEESWEEFKDRQDKAQYDLINRYAELKKSMDDSEAYRQACAEMEKVTRKFHVEETTIF